MSSSQPEGDTRQSHQVFYYPYPPEQGAASAEQIEVAITGEGSTEESAARATATAVDSEGTHTSKNDGTDADADVADADAGGALTVQVERALTSLSEKAGEGSVMSASGKMVPPGGIDVIPAVSVTISEVASDPSVLSHFVFVSPDEGTPAAEALAANAAINVTKGDKFLHKLRGMKRPKLKSLNVMKQLKKYTKQNTEQSLSKNIKGKVIDGVHELYTLTAGMMLGMRVTIGHQSRPNESTALKIEDFTFVEKITFPAKGNNRPPYCTPPHSLVHTFKFKSYAPKVFKRLREYFSIDTASYMLSVCGNYNYLEFISNSKSGQFFFYSHDGKYMIKTQTKDENKFMKRILPHYYKFISENPHTQLVRILGMHRVKMYHLRRKVHFVIMGSVFDTPQEIHTIYDLKGSLVGRVAKKKERENGGVLKDMDLLTDQRKLHLGPEKKRQFLEQLSKDANFLASLNIMDYSLLVGIHDRSKRTDKPAVNPAGSVVSHSNTPFRRRAAGEGDDSDSINGYPNATAGSPSLPLSPVKEGGESEQGSPSRSVGGAGGASSSSPTSTGGALRQVRSASVHVPSSSSSSGAAAGTDRRRRSLVIKRRTTMTAAGGAGIAGATDTANGSPRSKPASPAATPASSYQGQEDALLSESYDEGDWEGDEGDWDEDGEGDGEEGIEYIDVEDEGDSDQDAPPTPSSVSASRKAYPGRIASPEGVDGKGLFGPEGSTHLSRIIRPNSMANLAALVGIRGNTPRSDSTSSPQDGAGPALGQAPRSLPSPSLSASAPSRMPIQSSASASSGNIMKSTATSSSSSSSSSSGGRSSKGAQTSSSKRSSGTQPRTKFSPLSTSDRPDSQSLHPGERLFTYGPGQTARHPWTSRYDNGINSRVIERVTAAERDREDGSETALANASAPTPKSSKSKEPDTPGNSPSPRDIAIVDANTAGRDGSPGDGAGSVLGMQCAREVRGDEIYYVGVIDILQQYNLHKRGENFLKRLVMDVSKISAVDPQTYAARFLEFMADNID